MNLRPAVVNDVTFLFCLRNDPDVILASQTQREVTPMEHYQWFVAALDDPTEHLFIIDEIGAARITEVSPGRGEISIALVPEMRGYGFGRCIVENLKTLALAMGLTPHARIRKDNLTSIKCFRACEVEFELI